MLINCYSDRNDRKDKMQKAALYFFIFFTITQKREETYQFVNLKGSHCFWQGIRLAKNGTSKIFEINVNIKHKRKQNNKAT